MNVTSCDYGFHCFPADLNRREAWEVAIRREHQCANQRKPWRATKYSRLCVVHILLKVQLLVKL